MGQPGTGKTSIKNTIIHNRAKTVMVVISRTAIADPAVYCRIKRENKMF
jgi:hypothetical protein